MMTKAAVGSALAALVLMASGCGSSGGDGDGGDGQSKEDAQASKAISDYFVKQSASGSAEAQLFSVNRKEADCLGDGWVDKIGTSDLQKYGLLTKSNKVKGAATPDNLKMSRTDAKAAADVLFDCTDVATKVKNAITKQSGVTGQTKRCIEQALTDERLRVLFTGVFSGHQAQAQKQLTAPLMKCATGSAG